MYENLTICIHHINERSRISINIKVNYSLKRSYRRKTSIRKVFWGAFHASRIEKELKINSKPRFENELELSLARSCLRPAQHVSYQFTAGSAISCCQNWLERQKCDSIPRVLRHYGHRFTSFWSNTIKRCCNNQSGEYLQKTEI